MKIINEIKQVCYKKHNCFIISRLCLFFVFICNLSIGRCIPGYLYEPKLPEHMLKEQK